MDVNDWKKVLEAILLRVDWAKMTENSDRFLDLLQQFAKEEKIAEIAGACHMYFEVHGGARRFVTNALPGIILNEYWLGVSGVHSSRFREWSQENHDWEDRIRTNASLSRFPWIVESMTVSLRGV